MDRPTKPYKEVKNLLGNAAPAWEKLVGYIRYYYELDEIWAEGKPTQKHYNNLFFKRSGKALISCHLRDGHFLVCVVLGKTEREKFDARRNDFSETVCKEYDATEALHDGKWLGFTVKDDSLHDDFIRLMHIKRKPNRKVASDKTLAQCGRLDIGLSYSEITACIKKDCEK
ncbi:MAG: DUF3788 domain-containing protein [Defluviitaleaceae bacterium]|nr:DUF3788 domain-containing protein [Defluviitaleaceae bacterium]